MQTIKEIVTKSYVCKVDFEIKIKTIFCKKMGATEENFKENFQSDINRT